MAQLVFDPIQGVILPTTKEIRADLATKFKQAFRTSPNDPDLNTDPTSPMGQIIDLLTAEIEAKNAQIAFLANMTNPDTARGVFLDALSSLYFLERKTSEPTLVRCQCEGAVGTVIPYGAIVKDEKGNKFRHVNANGAKITDSGRISTIFESVEHGAIQAPPNSVNKIITVVAGWESVTNPVAGVVGRDAETDAELRERRLSSVSINARGSVSALEAEVRNVEGVIHGVVLENISNVPITEYGLKIDPHSVAVCAFGGEDVALARAIWAKKAGGCGTSGNYSVQFVDVEHSNTPYKYKITRPNPVKFRVRVTLYASSVGEAEKKLIRNAVIEDFYGRGGNPRVSFASTVYASRFSPVVAKATQTPIKNVYVSIDNGEFALKCVINADKQPTITAEDIEILNEAE